MSPRTIAGVRTATRSLLLRDLRGARSRDRQAARGGRRRRATVFVVSGDAVGPEPRRLAPAAGGAGATRLLRLRRDRRARRWQHGRSTRRFDPVQALRDLLPKDFRKNLAREAADRAARQARTAGRHRDLRLVAHHAPTACRPTSRAASGSTSRAASRRARSTPGAEYEAVCRDLEAALADLTDPTTRQARSCATS